MDRYIQMIAAEAKANAKMVMDLCIIVEEQQRLLDESHAIIGRLEGIIRSLLPCLRVLGGDPAETVHVQEALVQSSEGITRRDMENLRSRAGDYQDTFDDLSRCVGQGENLAGSEGRTSGLC